MGKKTGNGFAEDLIRLKEISTAEEEEEGRIADENGLKGMWRTNRRTSTKNNREKKSPSLFLK